MFLKMYSAYTGHGLTHPYSYHRTRNSAPPSCTSISGVLRAEISVPSSRAEWLQTGRTGPSAEVVLPALLLTVEDVCFLQRCFCYLTLITARVSIEFS